MRASRLVSILLLLQSRGRMTAAQLAAELEVSVRTVYRDVESLHEAGIPLYGDAGHRGGYQLLDGYRTRLTGLNAAEAQALFLSGLPGPAAELGLGPVLAAAQLKLLAALPPGLGEQVGRVQARFHLDAPGWYSAPDEVPLLPAPSRARSGMVAACRSGTGAGRSRPTSTGGWSPTGWSLRLAAGTWWRPRDRVPTGSNQILDLRVLEEEFGVPDGFELARYWQGYLADFRAHLHRADAVVRLAPAAAAKLSGAARLSDEAQLSDEARFSDEAEAGGWVRAVVPIESVEQACREFLALGADIEVLDPPALRARLAAAARATAALYG